MSFLRRMKEGRIAPGLKSKLDQRALVNENGHANGKPKEQVGQENSSRRKAYDADLSVRPWPDRSGSRRGGRGGEGDGAIGEGDAVQAAQGTSFISHLRPSS